MHMNDTMNDTKLNSRQLQILEHLNIKSHSRDELASLLNETKVVSKITLIRDLNSLIDQKLVVSVGSGRAISYKSNQNPILRIIDVDKYFEENSSIRKNIKSNFDFTIFEKLNNLFTEEEQKNFLKSAISLKKRLIEIDPTIVKRETERFTVEFAWKSSKIEGNTYTLLETEALIKHAHEAYGRSKYEAEMILNHKRAVDFILQDKDYFNDLTLEKIIKLHSILIKDLEVTEGIRDGTVAITGTGYIPMSDKNNLKKALVMMVDCINKSDFPLEKALIASSMVAYIQGFFDGNKRTSRTLANAILISHDYYPLSYRDQNESDYIKNMILFYEQGTLNSFKKMIINQFNFSQENYFRI